MSPLYLVAALNALPTEADTHVFQCGTADSPARLPFYRIVFSYRVGPPTEVTVAPCLPAVHNGSLQAPYDARVVTVIGRILAR